MKPGMFDPAGRRVLLVVAAGACAPLGAQVLPPSSSPAPVVQFEYDALGQLRRSTLAPDTGGYATTRSFDPLGRLRSSQDARQGLSQLGYAGGTDEVARVQDPRGLVTRMSRDGFGQLLQLDSPDTGTRTQTYDAAGNLQTRIDSRGVQVSHGYDALNRRTRSVYSWGSLQPLSFTWTYDETGPGFSHGIGRLTSTSYNGGGTRHAYDAQGRLVAQTQFSQTGSGATLALQTGYGYDAAGHVISLSYPSGRVVQIDHQGGRAHSISLRAQAGDPALLLIDQIRYEPFGVAGGWVWQMASGPVAHPRSFDIHGRMVRHPLGDGRRSIRYDAADRIAGYADQDPLSISSTSDTRALSQAFDYDELGRLTGVRQAGRQWVYAYDANGNRTEVQVNGSVQAYATDPASNRLLAVSNPPRQFGYDPAGNRLSDLQGTALATSGYDLSNRLATMSGTVPGARKLSLGFQYNAFGQRVAKLSSIQLDCSGGNTDCVPSGPQAILFVYDQQGHLLGEYRSQDGAMLREYIWLDDIPVAVIAPDAAMPDDAPAVYFIHSDHLDTPRVIVDRHRRIRWTWLSEPFGTALPDSSPKGFQPLRFSLRFAGQYFDEESRLMHNGFRDFDPAVGRYVQSDPIGLAGGINTYSYADGQPTSLTDPLGLATYMCRAPLHALTGAFGEARAKWAMSNVPMAHHRYLCVPGQCGGQDQRGEKWSDPLWGPGRKSKDEFNAERCEQKEPDNICIETCVRRRLDGPRPTYGIPLATDCQEWAEEVLNSCRYECSSNMPTDRPYFGYPIAGRRSSR